MNNEQLIIVVAAVIHASRRGTGLSIAEAIRDARNFILLAGKVE